jgi:hypothetical protein
MMRLFVMADLWGNSAMNLAAFRLKFQDAACRRSAAVTQFLRDNRNPGIERFFGSMEVTLTPLETIVRHPSEGYL